MWSVNVQSSVNPNTHSYKQHKESFGWGIGVQTSVNNTNQDSSVYNNAEKFNEQSVKDTMIQNYVTDIVNRTEDITELVKNFTNNVSAEADSIQKNTTKFAACIDLDGAAIKQTNELVQNVKQGFEQLYEDTKVLKQAVESQTDKTTTSDQTSSSDQGATSTTDQSASQEQGSEQHSEQSQSFTAMRAYNKYKMRERFGVNLDGDVPRNGNKARSRSSGRSNVGMYGGNKNNSSTSSNRRRKMSGANGSSKAEQLLKGKESFWNLRPKNPRMRIGEYFQSWAQRGPARLSEPFCLFSCVDIQTSVNNTNQSSRAFNNDLQTNINTQDIYKKIDTAYNNVVETIKKISETINQTTNSLASASSIQINEFIIETPQDACMLNLKNLSLDQSNKLTQNVELTTAIQNINSMTQDNEVKAIMSDMMGLTQGSDTSQKTESSTTQKSDQTQTSTQTSTQSQSSLGAIIAMIIVAVIVLGLIGMLFKGAKSFDEYFDEPSKKKLAQMAQAAANGQVVDNAGQGNGNGAANGAASKGQVVNSLTASLASAASATGAQGKAGQSNPAASAVSGLISSATGAQGKAGQSNPAVSVINIKNVKGTVNVGNLGNMAKAGPKGPMSLMTKLKIIQLWVGWTFIVVFIVAGSILWITSAVTKSKIDDIEEELAGGDKEGEAGDKEGEGETGESSGDGEAAGGDSSGDAATTDEGKSSFCLFNCEKKETQQEATKKSGCIFGCK